LIEHPSIQTAVILIVEALLKTSQQHANVSLQKQSCYFSKMFGYYSCVTILTMQIL